jgi:hypothetical protein
MNDERSEQVRSALLKGLGVIAVIAVVIALGTTLLVRALGLDSNSSGDPVGSSSATPPSPLPTKALPQPSDSKTPSDEPSGLASPTDAPIDGGNGDIQLDVSPVIANAMERVNLTGTYQGGDNVQLQVQRFDDGTWSNFNAKTTVRVGTFATFIMTGRVGENRFRVYDPQAKKGSNVVLVTIQ